MKRYAIQHVPSNMFLYEDEGGLFLVDESDAFVSFGREKDAIETLKYVKDSYCYESDIVSTEDGEFNLNEFIVLEI